MAAPLATSLTYLPPEGGNQTIAAGCCVLVPLAGRQLTGYVLGPGAWPVGDQHAFTLRPITALLAPDPFFPASLIPFYRWIAEYYHHPIGEVIRTALPLAPGARSGRQAILTAAGHEMLTEGWIAGQDAKQGPWLRQLAANGRLEAEAMARVRRDTPGKSLLARLERQGLVRIDPQLISSGGRAKTRTALHPGESLRPVLAAHPGADAATIAAAVEAGCAAPLRKSERKALHGFLTLRADMGDTSVPRARLAAVYPGHGPPLRGLAERGLLILADERVHRDPFGDTPAFHPPPLHLTDEQNEVLARLVPAITAQRFAPFVLFGVTGCGKTEVYLQAVRRCLDEGRTALVLVPEIALAAQLEAHFHSRFGERLAVLHSGLSEGERFDQWQRVCRGEATVVLGARSAVFAPLERLGLVIVDEEHEPAYKQEDGLRYNGRDLAVLRARQAGCPVLLGSATPSVVSYHHCRQGKYALLTMSKRVEDRPLPRVDIVDLATIKRSRPDLVFSDELIAAMRETFEARQQTLLFVNRRGFSSFMLCRDCGHILQCRHCQVSLTLHRARKTLLCHYCGYGRHVDALCPACSSTRVTGFGIGSERIEQEAAQLFPEARIARLDSDTSANRRHYLAVLKAVRDREIDILIGTQMIAKGLHFPDITLVGVVWADAGLAMPDYKASERTFSLLAQVTGRAGRGDAPGRVLVQTYQPNHYAIQQARSHDYPGFFEREIDARRPLAYPPFSRLVNIRISGLDEDKVRTAAHQVADFLRSRSPGRVVEILGPSPAPLMKLKDRTRWQLMLKSAHHAALHELCRQLLAEQARICPRPITLTLDVDPENMM